MSPLMVLPTVAFMVCSSEFSGGDLDGFRDGTEFEFRSTVRGTPTLAVTMVLVIRKPVLLTAISYSPGGTLAKK